MCDVLWGSRDVGQSVTVGGGSKLVQNSMTYFMDGPLPHTSYDATDSACE